MPSIRACRAGTALLLVICCSAAAQQRPGRVLQESEECPPPNFDALIDFNIEAYIEAPWYVQKQVRARRCEACMVDWGCSSTVRGM